MISVTLRSLGVVSSRIINLGCFKVTSCRCSSQVAAATSVNLVDKGVNIDWRKSDREQSGEQPVRGSFFHGIWLRHNCHCPLCYNLHSDQFTVEADELPNVRVTQAKVNGDNLNLAWQNDKVQHEGFIPLDWLKDHCYPDEEPVRKRHESEPIKEVPKVDYEEVMSGDEGLWKWLWNLKVHGMCIVDNTPTVIDTMIPLAERISYIQETMYGRTFNVVTSNEPLNIAYADDKLPLHMDQVFYEGQPGLQLLHCIKNEPSGGESLLVDSYPVLEELRAKHPEEFYTLTRVPTTFQRVHYKRDPPTHIVYQKPHITLGRNDEIIEFRWSQGLRGPLHVPVDDVEPYYKAYVLLAEMLKTSDRLLEFRLLPGQVMSVDNRRVLHGRNKFKASEGARQLQGCYVNYDEFNSRFKTLNNIYGPKDAP